MSLFADSTAMLRLQQRGGPKSTLAVKSTYSSHVLFLYRCGFLSMTSVFRHGDSFRNVEASVSVVGATGFHELDRPDYAPTESVCY